jgi:prefoldin subunit 5
MKTSREIEEELANITQKISELNKFYKEISRRLEALESPKDIRPPSINEYPVWPSEKQKF